MTRSVRSRVLRAALAGLVVAGLLPAGLSTSTAAPAPATTSVTAATELSGPAGDKAARPYMGWSSYSMQVYNPNGGSWITADQLIAQSDAMHAKLQPYGYEYINIDAGWNDGIDEYGRPTPSKKLYPNGLQAVIDHIHANGQKFGLYTIPGISKAVIDAKLPIYGAPGCTTGDLPVLPLQKADYWGIGYRIDFSKPVRAEVHRLDRGPVRLVGPRLPQVRQRHPGLGDQRPVAGRPRRRQGLVAGPEAEQHLVRAVLGARHQLRRLLEAVRERLADRLGRRVLLHGYGADRRGRTSTGCSRSSPNGGGTRDRAAGTTSTRSTSATARWTA